MLILFGMGVVFVFGAYLSSDVWSARQVEARLSLRWQ